MTDAGRQQLLHATDVGGPTAAADAIGPTDVVRALAAAGMEDLPRWLEPGARVPLAPW